MSDRIEEIRRKRKHGMLLTQEEADELLAALDRVTQEQKRDKRKVDAYDAARAVVKTEGNTRAYYVLRAEAAERRVDDLLDSRKRDTETIDSLIEQRRILDERVKELTEALNDALLNEARWWEKAEQALASGSPEGSEE